jgi:small conductance mechanosensitive channel
MGSSVDILITLAIQYLPSIFMAILTLIVGLWLIRWVGGMTKRLMAKREFDATLRPFVSSIIDVGLKILLLISVAGMFGVETTSFIAIFTALTFAIGMALQGTLGHFASGVLLLVLRPYEVGHFVEVNGREGTVHAIQIFNTVLLTPDGRRIMVPNGSIANNTIVNFTAQGERRMDLKFGISYEADIDKAKSIVRQLMENKEEIIKEKPIEVYVYAHGDSSVGLMARAWTSTADFWPTNFYLWEAVKKEFDKEGIGIPYPQLDVRFPEGSKAWATQ